MVSNSSEYSFVVTATQLIVRAKLYDAEHSTTDTEGGNARIRNTLKRYLHNSPDALFPVVYSFLMGFAHFSISGKNSPLQGTKGRTLKSRSILRRFTASQKNLRPRSTAVAAFSMSPLRRWLLEYSLQLWDNCSSRHAFSSVYAVLISIKAKKNYNGIRLN